VHWPDRTNGEWHGPQRHKIACRRNRTIWPGSHIVVVIFHVAAISSLRRHRDDLPASALHSDDRPDLFQQADCSAHIGRSYGYLLGK
jgi:hypothetical protein